MNLNKFIKTHNALEHRISINNSGGDYDCSTFLAKIKINKDYIEAFFIDLDNEDDNFENNASVIKFTKKDFKKYLGDDKYISFSKYAEIYKALSTKLTKEAMSRFDSKDVEFIRIQDVCEERVYVMFRINGILTLDLIELYKIGCYNDYE